MAKLKRVDGKAILERLAAERQDDRTKVSLYLSKDLYKRFQKACGEIPASRVMEELMREFLASADTK